MIFSRRNSLFILLLMGAWLILCTFRRSTIFSSLILNEFQFYPTNLLYSKYTTILNLTTQDHSNIKTPKSHEVPSYSTNSFTSTYTSTLRSTLGELSNTNKLKSQFWYDDQMVISRTSDCEKYFKQFVPVAGVDEKYLLYENSSNAPLAFSHLVHTQSAILEVK